MKRVVEAWSFRIFALFLCGVATAQARADWPMLHGNAQHNGFVQAELKPPFRLAWAREFLNERIGTAVEPIVGDDRVFVATHAGSLYALEAVKGEPIWRFEASGPFLHSPAFAEGLVLAGSTDGNLYALDARSGEPRWQYSAGRGGFAASPIVVGRTVCLGTRAGVFVAVDLSSGRTLWQQTLGAPIRQTAAAADGEVFVTGEDLKVRCFSLAEGAPHWTSQGLFGQTAQAYYPILIKSNGHTIVIVRTNPLLNMGQRIGRDRTLLCRNAGVDDSGWQKLETWIKSAAAHGTPEVWSKEQRAIVEYLRTNAPARSFYVLDGRSGQELQVAPVLWTGGCQSVGAMPALTAGGQLFTIYRSAYGNWNRGVAPLVALGLFDVASNRISPLFHQQGEQPPWNCFWGTADESQNFVVAGNAALIVHQGTLSAFDLRRNKLFAIHGERDTFGGFRNPVWARNEWHGPARGGVAVDKGRIFWQTGSRVLCINTGDSMANSNPAGLPARTDPALIPTRRAPNRPPPAWSQIRVELDRAVQEVLSTNWAPLFLDPGLAGRDFSFDNAGELFEALALAFPLLTPDRQTSIKARLAREWAEHPPHTRAGSYSLTAGAAREWYGVPNEFRARLGRDPQPHPFGNMYALWLYAERCSEWDRVLAAWPDLKRAYLDFGQSQWRLDAAKGDLFANRYLAALIAFQRFAEKAGEMALAAQVRAEADHVTEAMIRWWRRAADQNALREFKGSHELDPFIGTGDALSFAVAPHRHKLALLRDLTPEVADLVSARAPEAVAKVWVTFSLLYRTWPVVGEERQVHFGENFVDPPDLALNGFKALDWLRHAPADQLARHLDVPFCRADLDHLTKLALAIEASERQP